jgi:hypothetical protein
MIAGVQRRVIHVQLTAEERAVLAFAVEHGITTGVEILPSANVEEALTRLGDGDLRYRFVLDNSDLDCCFRPRAPRPWRSTVTAVAAEAAMAAAPATQMTGSQCCRDETETTVRCRRVTAIMTRARGANVLRRLTRLYPKRMKSGNWTVVLTTKIAQDKVRTVTRSRPLSDAEWMRE